MADKTRKALKTDINCGKKVETILHPDKDPGNKSAPADLFIIKKRVAVYCRVSTLKTEQESSIISQREHFESVVAENPEWELAGVYLEEGLSGTNAENRPQLQLLLAACKAGEVDLILTKSISRFARNTTDCITLVRLLSSLKVQILFEKENIYTGSMESEFFLHFQ